MAVPGARPEDDMPDCREHRFGWDGSAAPIPPAPAAVTFHAFVPINVPAGCVQILSFASVADALSFADWWGFEGMGLYAAYLDRTRVKV